MNKNYKRKFSIFISSTYEDLKEERQEVFDVALESDFIPVGMEQFHAYPDSQWNIIKKLIDECDSYLLIIGGCYGSIDIATGVSYTEKEYCYAKEKGIPILVLIRSMRAITQDKIDNGRDANEKRQKLDAFREKVKTEGNTVGFFGDINELKYVLSQSLKNVKDYFCDTAGWVRYNDIQNIINEKLEKINGMAKGDLLSQANRLNGMEEKLNELITEIDNVKNEQFVWQEIEPVTRRDLDEMFKLEGDTLFINTSKSNTEDNKDT